MRESIVLVKLLPQRAKYNVAQVTLRNLHKRYDTVDVIKGISLDIQEGEFLVFVGPSGCGKSTTLRMIAGLESITSGDLLIDGVRANEVRPANRGAAMVFQSYALYPHMTVAQNMGFALKVAGVSKNQRDEQIQAAAKTLHITELLSRFPKELSGGQRQRVAIGRAIVRKPKVFLFDEPLSNLDAALRVNMRIELSRLHKELGRTMIYVTHDQIEAMTLGDRIAVFNGGVIEQLGAPMDLYNQPANEFVAAFLGSPKINFIDKPLPDATDAHLAMWRAVAGDQSAQANRVGVRPEHLKVTSANSGIAATVVLAEHLGDCTVLHLQVAGLERLLNVKVSAQQLSTDVGSRLGIIVEQGNGLAFDKLGKLIKKSPS
jgi:multiple sugar transport system ATP-binding protein